MPLNVLINDDNESISTLLNDILEIQSHTGVIASTGEEAKTKVNSQDFDAAFCDITLPDMSGWEVISYIRETSPKTKIIVISGLGDTLPQDKLKEYGVNYTVNKPFQINDVQEVLRQIEEQHI